MPDPIGTMLADDLLPLLLPFLLLLLLLPEEAMLEPFDLELPLLEEAMLEPFDLELPLIEPLDLPVAPPEK